MSKNSFKVLYIIPTYSDEPIPRHARIHDIIHNCHKVGIEPLVLTQNHIKKNSENRINVYSPDHNSNSIKRRLNFIKLIKEIGSKLLKETDIVHVSSGNLDNFYLPIKIMRKIRPEISVIYGPNITYYHPRVLFEYPEKLTIKSFFRFGFMYFIGRLSFFSKEYDALMFQGKYHKNRIKQDWPIDKTCFIFRSRVSTDLFNPHYDSLELNLNKNYDLILGYAGGDRPGRGLNILLNSLNYLSEKTGPKIKLLLAGKKITSTNLDKNFSENIEIEQIGSLSRKEMPKFYNSIDALILPSVNETSPTIVSEALSCGTPVIASDIPSVRELIHPNSNAILFELRNERDLAKKIIRYYENMKSFKNSARNNYREYDILNELKSLKKFYSKLKTQT